MPDGDKVDPADEPDTSATPGEPEDGADQAAEKEPAPIAETRAGGREKKDKATPKQKQGTVEHRRTGPITFVQQSVGELRKVVYPTRQQLANYFVVVLIFVLFIIAYVSLLDLGIGAAVFRIFA